MCIKPSNKIQAVSQVAEQQGTQTTRPPASSRSLLHVCNTLQPSDLAPFSSSQQLTTGKSNPNWNCAPFSCLFRSLSSLQSLHFTPNAAIILKPAWNLEETHFHFSSIPLFVCAGIYCFRIEFESDPVEILVFKKLGIEGYRGSIVLLGCFVYFVWVIFDRFWEDPLDFMSF